MLSQSGRLFVRVLFMPQPSPTPVDLSGCTAIVTGAAQGLGLEMATELSRGGAKVVLADVQVDKARAAAEGLVAEGLDGSSVKLDVTDSQAVSEVFASVAAENGHLDIVVNNAGVGQQLDRISDLPDEEWDRVLAATLTGTFYCGRAAAAIMERQESGAIVNISSINGQNPAALAGAYNVAKAGVISLTRTMALELASYGVRVNAVCPGPVYTDFNRSVMRQRSESLGIEEQEMVERVRAAVPLGRWGEPRDIARMVAWLASPAADWMTGEVVRVSGGLEGVSAAPPKRARNDDEETT
jgi:NAD(P)-dependent dehydrogenase (short-subunit alcohol dehydrogenase family)